MSVVLIIGYILEILFASVKRSVSICFYIVVLVFIIAVSAFV